MMAMYNDVHDESGLVRAQLLDLATDKKKNIDGFSMFLQHLQLKKHEFSWLRRLRPSSILPKTKNSQHPHARTGRRRPGPGQGTMSRVTRTSKI